MENKKPQTISSSVWLKHLREFSISKSDMNNLVMNYFIVEGHKEAAEQFFKESHTTPSIDLESITGRMHIRNHVINGEIDKAIQAIQVEHPQLLKDHPQILFQLNYHKLLSLISQSKQAEALQWAQECLVPSAQNNNQLLNEVEQALTLLIFERPDESPLSELLHLSKRQKTASELNSVLLMSQNQDKDPKIPQLLKLLKFSQNRLKEQLIFPEITDFPHATFSSSTKDSMPKHPLKKKKLEANLKEDEAEDPAEEEEEGVQEREEQQEEEEEEEEEGISKDTTLKELLSASYAGTGRPMSQDVESTLFEREDEEVSEDDHDDPDDRVDKQNNNNNNNSQNDRNSTSSGLKIAIVNGKIVLNSEPSQSSSSLPTRGRKERTKSKSWKDKDTQYFYQCLQKCGTDFSLIQKMFQNQDHGPRTRVEIKNKFKREQKINPEKIIQLLQNPISLDIDQFRKIVGTSEKHNNMNLNTNNSFNNNNIFNNNNNFNLNNNDINFNDMKPHKATLLKNELESNHPERGAYGSEDEDEVIEEDTIPKAEVISQGEKGWNTTRNIIEEEEDEEIIEDED